MEILQEVVLALDSILEELSLEGNIEERVHATFLCLKLEGTGERLKKYIFLEMVKELDKKRVIKCALKLFEQELISIDFCAMLCDSI